MKKLIIILFLMLIGLSAQSKVVIENDTQKLIFNEPDIKEVITVDTPSYGVKVFLKNGKSYYLQSDTRGSAVLMMTLAYESLQKYYGWSDNYYYSIIEKQDKAQLGIH